MRIATDNIGIANVTSLNSLKGKETPIISFQINNNQVDAPLNSSASQNLIDTVTVRALQIKPNSLLQNKYLRTVYGAILPVITKVGITCLNKGKLTNLPFAVTKYTLPYNIVRRPGMTKLFAGWFDRLTSMQMKKKTQL